KSHSFFSAIAQQHPMLISGWQEIVQNEDGTVSKYAFPSTQAAHVWVWETSRDKQGLKGIPHAAKLAESNYPVVLAFADDIYFDHAYTPDKWEPGLRWAGSFHDTSAALQSSLDATRTEDLISPNYKHNLSGIEAALWSENIPTFEHLSYMALPKMAGLAEAAWANKTNTTSGNDKINWQSLAIRLGDGHKGFLNFINRITGMKYRGYPHGITLELPEDFHSGQ
ncbi:MAG TPA: family 20 glycosylhydrolase, partial [Gammaproteobacteria bacterium]|nr:family 20 glycosylhydrolase [Gammaproteobacteria bacterium]